MALNQVTSSLASQGVGGPIPSYPGSTTTDSGQISAGDTSASGTATGGPTSTGTAQTSNVPAGITIGQAGPFAINVPSGAALLLIGILLIVIGGIFLLAGNKQVDEIAAVAAVA